MIRVHSTAVRAWVEPDQPRYRKSKAASRPWRPAPFDKRVLVFDTETRTDYSQRLLYCFYRLYVDAAFTDEGLVVGDELHGSGLAIAMEFARIHDVKVLTRTQFVEQIFYPEVYVRGTLCVGFNLPFDLARIAIHAGLGTGKNRRKFSFVLSRRIRWPRLRIESISGRAAFIGFAPKKKLAKWERPFFPGRFLDLSTAAVAFTGEHHSLRSAGRQYSAAVLKSDAPALGNVTPEALAYGRRDVEATLSLFECLRKDYQTHPFASMANEREMPSTALPITKIFSTASIAKQYLRLMGFSPLLKKQPRFNRRYLGLGAAAYYGGRAEVRVRKTDVPVTVLDFTSMYPTVFILQDLQRLLAAKRIRVRKVTTKTQQLLDNVTYEHLFDPSMWPNITRLVRIRPDDDILPVRFKVLPDGERTESAPYSISVTTFTSETDRWCSLAEVITSKLLSGKIPYILEALEFYADGTEPTQAVCFRNTSVIDPAQQIFKTVVEQRHIAMQQKKHSGDPGVSRLDQALKTFANSGAYGINFEVNVTPSLAGRPTAGMVYADEAFSSADVHDERPGAYCNPIIASLVTGAARLILAMLECAVVSRGGTFAFCDTDSLAIVSGEDCPTEIPSLDPSELKKIVANFDRLNPYDRTLVKHLLKVEFPDVPRLRCWAISAKRYVLFDVSDENGLRIVKASESGLGGIIGRTDSENTAKLAEAIWRRILTIELGDKYNTLSILPDGNSASFDIPVRRKLPLAQPRILGNSGFRKFNRAKEYAAQIKPFGFIQAIMPAVQTDHDVQPIAPFEADERRSRKLPWVDLKTGKKIVIDWTNSGHVGAVQPMTLAEFVERYRNHPEAKAADRDGNPSGADTNGLLCRLRIMGDKPDRIGKEVDRLDEDDGTDLLEDGPIVYDAKLDKRREQVEEFGKALLILNAFRPKRRLCEYLKVTPRRLRDILKRKAYPRQVLRKAMLTLASSLAAQ